MNTCLTRVLKTAILGKKRDDKLFLNRNGKPYRDVSQAFKTALAKSDLKCRFHDLRHTFASHMVMSGVDIVTLKEILGHKTIEMTMRYSHLSATHRKDAVEKLGDAFSGKDSHLLDTRRFSGLEKEVVSVAG